MSALGQKRTHAAQQTGSLFDHLVGAAEQREWNGETKRLRDFEVNDQLNFYGLLDWQIGGIGAVENLAGIDASFAICTGKTGSVAHQAAGCGEFTQRVNRRQRVARRKLLLLHRAGALQDLRAPPGNRLEALSRDRLGQHSIRVNDQWRVCFTWRDGDAHDVEIVDYH